MKVQIARPPRNNIDLTDQEQVRRWSKRLGKSPEEIAAAVEKVGNTVAAVRKELGVPDPEPAK